MSAYEVFVSLPSGHSYSIPAPTLSVAIDFYREEIAKPGHRSVRVVGDGYDAEIGPDGPREVWDGLTNDERERVEEAEGRVG